MNSHNHVTCPDCGQVVFECSHEYWEQNPTACDLAVEQALNRHHSGECPQSEEYDHVETCPDCGQEYYRVPIEYWTENPNGAELGLSQAWDEHAMECPHGEYAMAWAEWREATGADNLSPRQWATKALRRGIPVAKVAEFTPPDRQERFLPSHVGLCRTWEEEVRALAVKVSSLE